MGKRIYCGNIPYGFTGTDLESLFSPYGAVTYTKVISDRETGRSRGFGFVELETDEAMDSAVQDLNGKQVEGRTLKVSIAKEKPEGGSRGGSGGEGSGGF